LLFKSCWVFDAVGRPRVVEWCFGDLLAALYFDLDRLDGCRLRGNNALSRGSVFDLGSIHQSTLVGEARPLVYHFGSTFRVMVERRWPLVLLEDLLSWVLQRLVERVLKVLGVALLLGPIIAGILSPWCCLPRLLLSWRRQPTYRVEGSNLSLLNLLKAVNVHES